MIHVELPVVPANYEARVRIPGLNFLAANPHPTGSLWGKHRYWRHIHPYLHSQLQGVCVYSSAFTPRRPSGRTVDHTSIDHYIPKSHGDHKQAYEWSNFRLCRARLNHRKGDFLDVLDPCVIQDGWFNIDFTTFAIGPNPMLPANRQQQVADTITRLELNDDDAYVTERARVVYGYADGKVPFGQISKRYPFIGAEMVAQNFDVVFLPRFQSVLANPKLRLVLIRQGWAT